MFTRSAADISPRTRQAVGAPKLWSRCSSPQRNMLCPMFFQEVTYSTSYISLITYSPIWKQWTWIFGIRRQSQFFGYKSIIPCIIADRRLRQKLRRTIFPEFRTSPIHQISARATFGSLECESRFWEIESYLQVIKLRAQLHKYGMTSFWTTSRACSGTGPGLLLGSLKMMESRFVNKTRFASSCRLYVETRVGAGNFMDTLSCLHEKDLRIFAG
jgi:hypothetical protein